MTVHVWKNGTTHTYSETAWAEICASFLGAGFRVDLPSGPDRASAARHEAVRVRRIAHVVGTELAEADWGLATKALPELAVEIVGGWPRTYTGEHAMRIATRPIGVDSPIATAELIPSRRYASPTSGLPMFSRLADELALGSIQADCGIWAGADGSIATSTAGPIIAQRSDGRWVLGTDSSSWAATQIAAQRGATADLRVADLATALFLGVISRTGQLQPVTYLNA